MPMGDDQRDAEYPAKLQALRDAACIGIEDLERGNFLVSKPCRLICTIFRRG
jgi:hypothetical protein